jgi:hypothetical protein
MKKINKKLSLNVHTVRVLSGPELELAAGGTEVSPTTTVWQHSVAAAGAVCIRQSINAGGALCRVTLGGGGGGGVHNTIACRLTP